MQRLLGACLLSAALLSTNITFGLTPTETVPALFLLVGFGTVIYRGRIEHTDYLWLIGAMFFYAFAGVLAGQAIDGMKLASAALVFFVALQIGPGQALVAACRISLGILFSLRVLSLAAPDSFAAIYESLGLRGAEYYGGTAAILFAEPSYLATAAFSMWAIGRLGEQRRPGTLGLLDLSAIAVLALSFSVWAFIDIVVGLTLILWRRPARALLYFAAAAIAGALLWSSDLSAGRLVIFLEAISLLIQSGQIMDFAVLDPSAAHRLVQIYLAFSSAISSPFGQFGFELSNLLQSDPVHWQVPIFGGAVVALQLVGQLYANTVPLQLLVFGGAPLFILFMAPVFRASVRLWRLRNSDDASLMILANIIFGCIGQSILNSPFLYLCVVVGLFWREPAAPSIAAAITEDENFSRYHQLQQTSGA